jgi:hypothetical protein
MVFDAVEAFRIKDFSIMRKNLRANSPHSTTESPNLSVRTPNVPSSSLSSPAAKVEFLNKYLRDLSIAPRSAPPTTLGELA